MMEDGLEQHLKRLYSETTIGDGGNEGRPRKQVAVAPTAARREVHSPADSHFELQSEPSKDWRELVRKALQLPDNALDRDLEEALQTSVVVRPPPPPLPRVAPSFSILHRVFCAKGAFGVGVVFLDEPMLVGSDNNEIGHLAGRNEIKEIRRFADRTPGLCFIAIREYRCCSSNLLPNPLGQRTVMGEVIYVASPLLSFGITALERENAVPGVPLNWPEVVPHTELRNLQYWLFSHREQLATFVGKLEGDLLITMACFEHYMLQSKFHEYEEVARLHEAGNTTREGLRYLLIPGTTLVVPNEQDKDLDQCMRLKEWPDFSAETLSKRSHAMGNAHAATASDPILRSDWSVSLKLMALRYNGGLKTQPRHLAVSFPWTRDGKGHAQIISLGVYPLAHADSSHKDELVNRGAMFWECRSIRHIQYSGLDATRLHHFSSARFMVDHSAWAQYMYRQPQNVNKAINSTEPADPLAWVEYFQAPNKSTDSPEPVDPPEALEYPNFSESADPTTLTDLRKEFYARLPPVLPGFDLQTKRWRGLATARCTQVQWDESAFQSLVLDGDTKDVVKALVTNKVTNTVSTDLIRGKGSGLILLFHGPPGTGKTLTAESVAEEAQKPLYRVTCADIGTVPQVVEASLVSILHLCKKWDCVVLLDEAEVFLQERSLTDLNRNALVAVFLRTLEYYDGIMILTSNRVGTFDEGFKSRIQLALHYPKLTQTSRRKVWQNFFDRLDNDPIASAELDIEDLRKHALALSRFELNGREIRNAINVARPLAISEGKLLDFFCLEKVIKVQRDFDKYLKEMNEGLGDEEVAREEGRR